MRLPPQGVIPPGRAGLVILAAALAAVVLRRARPLGRTAGDALIKAGEFLRGEDEVTTKAPVEAAAEVPVVVEGTEAEAEPPKPGVDTQDASNATNDTTKVGATAAENPITTASPTGQDELQAIAGVEAAGDGASPEPVPPTPVESKSEHERKETPPDGPLNPKRMGNTRED